MRRVLATALAVLALPAVALAGAEKIDYPAEYLTWPSFGAVDRYDRKTVRTFYVNPEALAQAKPGQPAPSGTVLVMEERKAKLDASGMPETDAAGRFIRTDDIMFVQIQAKKAGWGAEYPPEKRNGEWEYATFLKDGSRPPDAKFDACFGCHLRRSGERDYTFVFGKYLLDRK